MTWARLGIPKWLPNLDRVIYLDSDLCVNRDLTDLYEVDLKDTAVGLVYNGGKMRTALSRPLFDRIGFDLDAPYCNAGVMEMDLEDWRSGLAQMGLELARDNRDALPAADESVVNAMFYGEDVTHLDARHNVLAYPMAAVQKVDEKAVYHFIGARKPWDLLGEYASSYAPLFLQVLDDTALAGQRSYRWPTWPKVKTALRNGRQYVRAVKIRLGLERAG